MIVMKLLRKIKNFVHINFTFLILKVDLKKNNNNQLNFYSFNHLFLVVETQIHPFQYLLK